MNKAATKSVKAAPRAVRKAPAKLDIAKAVAPQEERFPMKKPSTAFAAGYLTAIQQAKNLLTHETRSFGEAIDRLNAIENELRGKLSAEIDRELKRVNRTNKQVFTANTPEGPQIVLRAVPPAPEVPAAPAAAPKADTAPAEAPKRRGRKPAAPKVEAPAPAPAAKPVAAPAKRAPRKTAAK